MRHTLTIRRLITGITLALACGMPTAWAIEQDQPFLMESWTLAPGSVLEILAVSDLTANTQITWSLTKADGSFVQADRGPLFRERFAETGDYLLRAEATAADQAPVAQRTFAVHIVAGTAPPPAGTGAFFLDPPFDANGIAVVDTNLQTILLSGQPGTTQNSVDVHDAIDVNGDGDASNDNDSRGTFFEADGSALRLWFVSGILERTLTVRGSAAAGPVTQIIRLYSGSAPAETSGELSVQTTGDLQNVRVEDRGNGTYAFSVDATTLSLEGRAILLFWDFGDGHQSMLDQPVHTYAENGEFTVRLQARDLATAENILTISGILPVTTLQPAEQSSSTQSSAAASSEDAESSQSSRFSLRSILMIGGGILLAILVGFVLVAIIGKIVQRKLDSEPPAPLNGKPGKKSPPRPGLPSFDQSPPLSVASEEISPMEIMDVPASPAEQEEKQSPAGEPQPSKDTMEEEGGRLRELTFKEDEAPSWLKQGHEEAKRQGHTVETAPAPSEPSPPPPPPSKPVEEKESRPLTPWLEPTPQATEEIPSPAPSPAPAPTPEPPTPPNAPVTVVPMPPAPAPSPIPAPPQPVLETPGAPQPALEPPTPTPDQAPGLSSSTAAVTPSPVPPSSPIPSAPPPVTEKKTLTEAEQERRRKKRARYRANKKKREDTAETNDMPQKPTPAKEEEPAEQTPAEVPAKPAPAPAKEANESDEPIAIIRAENISQDQKDQKKS